jgi:hypothetical protein
MRELQQAVRLLAEFTSASNPEVTPEIKQASAIYAAACRQVNDRLSECDRLVSVNQRSEAIRQVQLEPDVLDLYKLITFPMYDEWQMAAQLLEEIKAPPTLNAEAARRLNQAYAAEEVVQPLLVELRQLVLQRAPLSRRLELMRLLCKAEPTNVLWYDDVRAYESVRIDELRMEMTKPEVTSNWDQVRALYAEVSSKEWQTSPPLDLVDAIKKVRTSFRRRAMKQAMDQINPRLVREMQAGNLDAVVPLISQANEIANQYGVASTDPLMQTVTEAADWVLAERKERKLQQEFAEEVQRFRTALQDGTDWYYVQNHFRAVKSYNRPIPPDVLKLFNDRLRMRQLILLAIIGGVVLLIGGIIVVVLLRRS